MKNVNYTIYPNKAKTSARTGKTPIYLRLFGDGKTEVSLDRFYSLSPQDLLRWDETAQRLRVRDSEVNDYLNLLAARFKKLKTEFLFTGKSYSLEEIKDYVLNSEEQKADPTVAEYAKKFLREDIENNPDKKEGTKKNYRNAINQLICFLQYRNKVSIKFKDFDFATADAFKKYLESSIPGLPEKEQNQTVSSSTKIKNVKPIFSKAINEGFIQKSPFAKLKLNFESPKAFYLNISQLKALHKLELSHNPSLQFTKDLFLFMCFTGMSYADAINLSRSSIEKRPDGRIFLDTTRIKSSVAVRQVLTQAAQSILEKYLEVPLYNKLDRTFPDETGESVNRKLKILGASIGITGYLSTKTGRNTCSELFFHAGLEEELLINCFMGWSNNKNIRKKYYGLSYEKLLNFTERLDIFLDQTLKS